MRCGRRLPRADGISFGGGAVVFRSGGKNLPRVSSSGRSLRRDGTCGRAIIDRVEACGAHARLPKLRASAAGGFGPPHLRAMSVRPAAERRGLPRAVRRVCSPPPGGGCGLPALPRAFSRGQKPAERTHSTDAGLRCGRLRPADPLWDRNVTTGPQPTARYFPFSAGCLSRIRCNSARNFSAGAAPSMRPSRFPSVSNIK